MPPIVFVHIDPDFNNRIREIATALGYEASMDDHDPYEVEAAKLYLRYRVEDLAIKPEE